MAHAAGPLRRCGGSSGCWPAVCCPHAVRRRRFLLLQVLWSLRCQIAALREAKGPLQANWLRDHARCHYDHHPVRFRPNFILVGVQEG